jgi:hypothetical protein
MSQNTAVAELPVDQLPVAPPAGSSPVMTLLSDAIQKQMPIEVIREIKDLAKELAADEARRAFDRAVSEAKANIPPITKNRRVGFESRKPGAARTDYAYEDFAQVAKIVGPHLAAVGLSYRFRSEQEGAQVRVTCILAHRDGHSEETTLVAAADTSGNKNSIQAVGSTVTYLQRYTLKMALGLAAAEEDDDGGKHGVETITAEQADELMGLIDAAIENDPDADRGVWIETFLNFMKAEAIHAIPAGDFEKARSAIRNAARQRRRA